MSLSWKLLSKLQFVFAERKQAFAYNDNYLKLAFTSVVANGEIRPKFVLCSEVLARGSLKDA